MPTLNIQGRNVTVDDKFLSMSREQQNATVDEIAKSLGLSGEQKSSGIGDFLKSIPRGVVGGLTSAASALGQSESLEMSQPDQAAEIPGAEETTGIVESTLTGPMHKPEGAAGRYGESIGQTIGNPASWMGPGSVLAKGAANVLSGAGAQAGEDLTGSGLGRFAGGVAGAALPRVGLRGVSPSEIPAIRQPHVAELRAQGVEPMAGDVTGSKVLRHREEMGEYFGGNHSYSRNKEQVARQFTRAANRYMGEDADQALPEVIQRARERIGQTFERVAMQLPITMDRQLGNDLVQIEQDLFREGLPVDTVRRITQQVDNINSGFVTGTRNNRPVGIMPGQNYQAATRTGTPLARAIEDPDPNISHYAGRIRTALDDAMERSANARGTRPGVGRRRALEELQEARRQWYTMLVISKSVAGAGEAAAEGLISPAKLRQNLTSSADNKLSYAAGRTGLQNLARSGVAVLTPEKSSGTAERLVAHTPTLTGLATGLVGRGINLQPVQSWLKNAAAPGAAPYVNQMPTLPWSMLRGGVDMLSPQGDQDALAR